MSRSCSTYENGATDFDEKLKYRFCKRYLKLVSYLFRGFFFFFFLSAVWCCLAVVCYELQTIERNGSSNAMEGCSLINFQLNNRLCYRSHVRFYRWSLLTPGKIANESDDNWFFGMASRSPFLYRMKNFARQLNFHSMLKFDWQFMVFLKDLLSIFASFQLNR